MNMTREEKQILTLLDDSPADDFVDYVRKIVDYPEPMIRDAVDRFLRMGLIEKINIPTGDEEKKWFFFTQKVTKNMLDDDVRYKNDMAVHLQDDISYQIEDETEEKSDNEGEILIKAGRTRIDLYKAIQYEGIILHVAKEARDREKIVFTLINIERGKEHDTFYLGLHATAGQTSDGSKEPYIDTSGSKSHIAAREDIVARLTISRRLLKRWTKLEDRENDDATDTVKMGSNYDLMTSLPKSITLTKYKLILSGKPAEKF